METQFTPGYMVNILISRLKALFYKLLFLASDIFCCRKL